MVTHLAGLVTSLARSPGGPGGGGGRSCRISSNGFPVVVCDLLPWPFKLKSFGGVSGETVKFFSPYLIIYITVLIIF